MVWKLPTRLACSEKSSLPGAAAAGARLKENRPPSASLRQGVMTDARPRRPRRCVMSTPQAKTLLFGRLGGLLGRRRLSRRVATRYDKLAANYLAFVQLASIRLWLRVDEFTS